ncbi:MAG: penicillin-binding protein 2 [Gammaproteobacteria bacterium]
MAKLPTLKDPQREAKIFQVRVRVTAALIVMATCLILGRLAYLQVIQHQHFTTLAQDNRLKLLAIPPTRGLIFSRDGEIVAENRPSFVLEMVAENVQDIDGALSAISEFVPLDTDTINQLQSELSRRRGFDPVVVKTGLSEEEVAIFSVNQYKFPGFRIVAKLSRHYPLRELMAHVTGYVGRINEEEATTIDARNYRGTTHIGKNGVERAREQILHGDVGLQRIEVNAQGRVIRIVDETPPVPGANIYLTIDAGLQRAAHDALGEKKGAIVAIDPNNGDVLAFVSKPSFDPNLFVDGISQKDYSALRNDKGRPLFNRALQAQYPPGSTIKPMVGLAGLNAGIRSPSTSTWCPGFFRLQGDPHRYRDWKKEGHGHVDLANSLAQSCDVYYYALAKDLTIDGLHDMLGQFGLGAATGIDLPGETAGLLPSREWKRRAKSLPWFPGETLIAGIGQGFMLVSPLQLATSTAALSSRGIRYIPRIVGQIEDPQNLQATNVGLYERAAVSVDNDEHWQAIIDGMVSVVHGPRGTARRIGLKSSYQIAGKTGTAQLFGIAQGESVDNAETPEHLKDHALFVAFAPADAPRMALAIIVENGGSGSAAAAPIARILFDHFLVDDEPET